MTDKRPLDITPKEREVYALIKNYPGLPLGQNYGLSALEAMSFGYIAALTNAGAKDSNVFIPDGFVDYVIIKLHGKQALRETRGAFNAIRMVEEDDKKGLKMFIDLLDEYLVSLGYEPILESKIKF